MGASLKFERYIAPEEVPALLRSLADQLDNGSDNTSLEGLEGIEDFRKLKLHLRREYGQVTFRVKAKCDGECAMIVADDGETLPDYKDLKQKMKRSFKMVFTSVHTQQYPPQEAFDAFVQQSRLMVQYPGFGDEQYEAYDKAVDELEEAGIAKDLSRIHQALDALAHLKGHCHSRHK